MTGIDYFSAFTITLASLNNSGSGLGIIVNNFTLVNHTAKWVIIIIMLFGRLEIFTFLIIFTPVFWKDYSINKNKPFNK